MKFAWLIVLTCVSGICGGAFTASLRAAEAEALAAAPTPNWAQLVTNLDSEEYQVREQASAELSHAGAEAVPFLARGIATGSPEVIWRGSQALQHIAVGGDEATLQVVIEAIQGIENRERLELQQMARDLRKRQQQFGHIRATEKLQQLGAKVHGSAELVDSGFVPFVTVIDAVMFAADDVAEVEVFEPDFDGVEAAGVEWAHEPEEMTLEDRLAMYEPIEVTFVEQFKAQAGKAWDVPGAIAGWEHVTAEMFADEVRRPADLLLEAKVAEAVQELQEEKLLRAENQAVEAQAAPAAGPLLDRLGDIEKHLLDPAEPGIEGVVEEEVPAGIDVDGIDLAEVRVLPAAFFLPDEVAMDEEAELAGEAVSGQTVVIDAQWSGGDEGVRELQGVQGATSLILNDAPLTDAALKPLGDMKNLAALQIQGGRFSAAALVRFHRDHPQLHLSARGKAWLGIHAQGTPCRIEQVVAESPAAEAGLKPGDVIEKIDDVALQDFNELTLALVSRQAGDAVVVAIQRKGTPLRITVKLQARP